MDYKYIEQLLERYWQCDTTAEEEQILRTFFSQESVPGELRQWQPLFAYERLEAQAEPLGADFDARLLALTEGRGVVKARSVSLAMRLMPLVRAAAVVAIIIGIGSAARLAMGGGREPEASESINYADYRDTFSDPAAAYVQVESALQLVAGGMSLATRGDTATAKGMAESNDSMQRE